VTHNQIHTFVQLHRPVDIFPGVEPARKRAQRVLSPCAVGERTVHLKNIFKHAPPAHRFAGHQRNQSALRALPSVNILLHCHFPPNAFISLSQTFRIETNSFRTNFSDMSVEEGTTMPLRTIKQTSFRELEE
jgi:hypothetical protein